MKDNNYIPYIVTIYGTLKTDSEDIEKMKKELAETNIQFLISTADSKFVEVNEDEILKNREELI